MNRINLIDFAKAFGCEIETFSKECLDMIEELDFSYEYLNGAERDAVILNVLTKLEHDTQIVGIPERTDIWEKGWNENFKNFGESDYDLHALIPKFYRPNVPMRYNKRYIKSANTMFEYDFFKVFRMWVYTALLPKFDSIYEFGCGTGHNLVELARLYPKKKIYGTDFVPATVALLQEINRTQQLDIKGGTFNMIDPPECENYFDKNSAILTFAVIEQLASKFEKWIEFILKNKPGLCVHMEPTIELYEDDSLIDHLAIKFHRQRRYTEGYLPRLYELEKENKIEILKVQRMNFGSLMMEAYNLIVWKPL